MMADQIELKELRIKVNEEYVGFNPDGDSIKPIHIAGGVFESFMARLLISGKLSNLHLLLVKKA